MKEKITKFILSLAICFCLTSCYTYTFSVGKGAQTGRTITARNHYLVNGLAPISLVKISELANGAQDYDVTITHSFIDGLINALTGGLYTPTTVTVTK